MPYDLRHGPMLAEAREGLERTMVPDALGRHDSMACSAGELGITLQGPLKLMARHQGDRFDPSRNRSAPESTR